jgi:hypothetical protein
MHRKSGYDRPPLLFNSVGIFDVIENGKAQVKELVRQVTARVPYFTLSDMGLPK